MDLIPNTNQNLQNEIEDQILSFFFFKISAIFNIMNIGSEQGFERKKEGGAT